VSEPADDLSLMHRVSSLDVRREIHRDGANTLRMLDDLGNRVDHTDSRLRKVTRTMNDFIRKNEGERARFLFSL
jgi:hypothetical protein